MSHVNAACPLNFIHLVDLDQGTECAQQCLSEHELQTPWKQISISNFRRKFRSQTSEKMDR